MAYSLRIKTIQNLVDIESDVYDICCDHGIIGLGLLELKHFVYFIDIVPEIIESLKIKLKDSDITNAQYSLITGNATIINFENKNDSKTFIVAGVGGELGIKIIENILEQSPDSTFIISIHKNQLKMRHYLKSKSFKILDEVLVEENKQFYEILKVSLEKGDPIEEIGSKMWHHPNEAHFNYLSKQREYYSKSQKYSNESKRLVNLYARQKQILLKIINNNLN